VDTYAAQPRAGAVGADAIKRAAAQRESVGQTGAPANLIYPVLYAPA